MISGPFECLIHTISFSMGRGGKAWLGHTQSLGALSHDQQPRVVEFFLTRRRWPWNLRTVPCWMLGKGGRCLKHPSDALDALRSIHQSGVPTVLSASARLCVRGRWTVATKQVVLPNRPSPNLPKPHVPSILVFHTAHIPSWREEILYWTKYRIDSQAATSRKWSLERWTDVTRPLGFRGITESQLTKASCS